MLALFLFRLVVGSNFCNVHGNFVEKVPYAIDTSKNAEASGLTLNRKRSHLFSVSDSPKDTPLVFVMRNRGKNDRTTIEIVDIKNTGFNGGYGDWEAIVSYPCAADKKKDCILIGDFGHNKARGKGGVERSESQMTRFIEIEEPTESELNSGKELEREGIEYSFTYPDGKLFDAEAMVVKDDRLFVITKNSKEYPYSHMFEVPDVKDKVELVERAIFQVDVSEVTDAASSPGYLILRTYSGLNFYKWDDLCDEEVRTSKVYQSIDYLTRGSGQQEAVEYTDDRGGYILLVGEKNHHLFYMKCHPAKASHAKLAFGSKCLNTFSGEATGGTTVSAPFPKWMICVVVGLILAVIFVIILCTRQIANPKRLAHRVGPTGKGTKRQGTRGRRQ